MPRSPRRVDPPQANKLVSGSVAADVAVARLARGTWGVLSVEELRACGLRRTAISVRVQNGRLHPLHRGVYAVGHANLSLEGVFLAAVKACGAAAVLSHRAAAALWGIMPWEDRAVDVTVLGAGTRTHEGIRVRRTSWLERRDVRVRDGIPVTSVPRTLLDLATQLSSRGLRRAVREAQAQRLVSMRELTDLLGRAGHRPGTARLAQVVAEGFVPTRSELEDVVLDLILRGGLERPDVNRPLTLGGRRLVPDFRWPEERLVVEADGGAWHDHKLAREDDAERQALLEAHGERVVRVTWDQAVTRRAQTLARLVAAGAPPETLPATSY
jgi:very-short-patch-repair endonuclease